MFLVALFLLVGCIAAFVAFVFTFILPSVSDIEAIERELWG